MKLERWDDAVAELQRTIELDPSHPQPHLLMSQILFRRGDEERAKQQRDLSLGLRSKSRSQSRRSRAGRFLNADPSFAKFESGIRMAAQLNRDPLLM